jgi:hypothetical protein
LPWFISTVSPPGGYLVETADGTQEIIELCEGAQRSSIPQRFGPRLNQFKKFSEKPLDFNKKVCFNKH